MNKIRERAEDWDVDPDILIEAIKSAKHSRDRREARKPIIASAEPAECMDRLLQARKAIARLPRRARANLHWSLAERLAYGHDGRNPLGLDPEQTRRLMGMNLVDEILAALTEPVEPEEPDREFQWLVRAWIDAGGQLKVDDRYDEDLIEFLQRAFMHLGEPLTEDAVRCRLNRIPAPTPGFPGVGAE